MLCEEWIRVIHVTVGVGCEVVQGPKRVLIYHTKLPRIGFTLVNNLHLLLGHQTLVHALHVLQEDLLELSVEDLEVSMETDDLMDVRNLGVFAYDHLQDLVVGINFKHQDYGAVIVLELLGVYHLAGLAVLLVLD